MSLHGDGNVNLKSLCGNVYLLKTERSKKTRELRRKSSHVERLENGDVKIYSDRLRVCGMASGVE